MKNAFILITSCSMSLLVGLVSGETWYLDGSVLQARHLDLLLPRATGPIPSGRRAGAAPQQIPPATNQPQRKATPKNQGPYARKGGSAQKIEPPAHASIFAKGSASMVATSPNEFHDAYNGHGEENKVRVEHPKRVLAVGTALGTPGGIVPGGGEQPRDQHPLRGEARARAVRGQVEAPAGGKGYMQIDSARGTQHFDVPGGTTLEKTVRGSKAQHARVSASVTDGGHIRVVGGPTKKSLNQEFPAAAVPKPVDAKPAKVIDDTQDTYNPDFKGF